MMMTSGPRLFWFLRHCLTIIEATTPTIAAQLSAARARAGAPAVAMPLVDDEPGDGMYPDPSAARYTYASTSNWVMPHLAVLIDSL